MQYTACYSGTEYVLHYFNQGNLEDHQEAVASMGGDENATVTLRLPSTLSAYSGGKSQIPVQARTVEELLKVLEEKHHQVWECLCNEQGHVREHIQIFVNNKLITGPHGLQTTLKPGEEVIVLPAVASA